ncbi:hypothetical protein [Halovivax limisalsi]|uniref:hypothetical protein n=1 Tax=Halovivax limisalsi TaxID=1453760 RepID=UPI001FFC4594|nr:hypothetical protein [Halovivax limisalsi]
MARFHLTDDPDAFDRANGLQETAGLTPYATVRERDHYISTYEKRAIDTENFRAFENGDFVAVIGTLFCGDKLGGAALRDVYTLFTDGSLKTVREACFGHYTVLVKHGETITVFTDPNGVSETYYAEDSKWFVSNSLAITAQCLDERTVDQFRLIQKAIEFAEVSRETLYTGVNRLLGTEKLVIDLGAGTLSTEPARIPETDWNYDDRSFDEVVETHAALLSQQCKHVVNGAGAIGIQATGGLDSRMVLASVLTHGHEPTILYGVGNSNLTNTETADLEVAKAYADRYDLRFSRMDWTGDYPLSSKTLEEQFRKYGFRYRMYGATPSVFDSLSSDLPSDIQLTMSGYGFGTVSNAYYWEMENRTPITIREIVTEVFSAIDQLRGEFTASEAYLDALTEDAGSFLAEYWDSVDAESALSLDEFVEAIQLLNGKSQSKYVNTVNEFTYHLAPLATYRISQSVLSFPEAYRRGERIRVAVLEQLFEDILNVDMFTGRRNAKITDEGEIDRTQTIAQRIAEVLPDAAVDAIEPLYTSVTSQPLSDPDSEILRQDIRQIHANEVLGDLFDIEHKPRDIRYPARLSLESRAVDMIGYDTIDRS